MKFHETKTKRLTNFKRRLAVSAKRNLLVALLKIVSQKVLTSKGRSVTKKLFTCCFVSRLGMTLSKMEVFSGSSSIISTGFATSIEGSSLKKEVLLGASCLLRASKVFLIVVTFSSKDGEEALESEEISARLIT